MNDGTIAGRERRVGGKSGGILALALTWAFAGCFPNPNLRLNSPPQGDAPEHPPWRDMYVYHNDQGMLADMSIADIHFVPHCANLSGTGEARLERYAELLASRGGNINYDPTIVDDNLIKARMETAKEFLAQALPSRHKIEVMTGPALGRGMSNAEATDADKVAKQAEKRRYAYFLNVASGLRIEGD